MTYEFEKRFIPFHVAQFGHRSGLGYRYTFSQPGPFLAYLYISVDRFVQIKLGVKELGSGLELVAQ